jgi:ATP-binding cassette subfamily F protein 3
MFGGQASDKKVKVLSGGERTRLAMIRLLLEPVNLLILDEPTNHLDMTTKDILKQAIKEFNGTVILVSHDREFLDGLVEKVYEFGGGKVTECLGGIYEFLEKKKIESLSELERNNTASKTADSKSAPTQTESPADKPRMSYAEQRERNKMLSRAERKVKDAEADIATIEQEIADVEAKIAEGNVDNDIFTTHADLQKKLENAMSLWELATIEYDELKESIN